jgi:hypothetical protein
MSGRTTALFWFGLLALVALPGTARADDKAQGHALRATATVEVIEDARQVDEIIARVKAREKASSEVEPERKNAASQQKSERPALPRAESLEKVGPQRERGERIHERRREERREREKERATPAVRR